MKNLVTPKSTEAHQHATCATNTDAVVECYPEQVSGARVAKYPLTTHTYFYNPRSPLCSHSTVFCHAHSPLRSHSTVFCHAHSPPCSSSYDFRPAQLQFQLQLMTPRREAGRVSDQGPVGVVCDVKHYNFFLNKLLVHLTKETAMTRRRDELHRPLNIIRC